MYSIHQNGESMKSLRKKKEPLSYTGNRQSRWYRFFLRIQPFTGRYMFLLLCTAGLIWYTIYTREIIRRLQDDATTVTQTYAELIRTAISENMNSQEMNVVFEEIIQKSNIPIVITDTTGEPIMWKNISQGFPFSRTIEADDTSPQSHRHLKNQAAEFKRLYDPKSLYISETQSRIGYLMYGNNKLVDSLSIMPFLEIGLIAAFMIFVYLGFHNIRVTERSSLWVGLAKETAHQLGTPISSLMGWVEYMRAIDGEDVEVPVSGEEFKVQVKKICDDMDNDLVRLRKVTARFSQIGSIPDLVSSDVNAVLEDALGYFRARLPLLGKKIELRQHLNPLPPVAVNRDLLEWVFENLLKNSLDAIVRTGGYIELRTEHIECDNLVRIFHCDNGKGISWEDQKKVFTPGFTTKKRGWGLGLTLCKRIVEEYHKGHIYVSWSHKDKGTIFCIDLPTTKKSA